MKADLTRLTFDPSKHYRAVQQQQGRVQLDADSNEQIAIAAHRVETGTIDVVGPCGAPLHADGFRLVASAAGLTADEAARPENQTPPAVAAGDLLITGGRLYAGGVLAENDRIGPASTQPDLPTSAEIAKVGGTPLFPLKAPGTWIAYLDVWPRLRTAIDDAHIREVALGGPDTATRIKNTWQVKFLPAPAGANCSTPVAAWDALLAPKPGTLAASVQQDTTKPSPCIVDPGSGYRRLENQLYRVEVHTGGDSLSKATFKWSRDNGSIVSRWLSQSALGEITVESTGRDKALNLAATNWVELTDDAHEELGLPGVFALISTVNGNVLTLDAPTAAMDFANFPKNPKVRRWDSAPATPGKWITPDGTSETLNTTDTFELEDGVVVEFGSGSFRTGDYWLIPARTALPQVEWPTTGPAGALVPVPLPPHGVEHHYCKLAIVEFKGGVFKISDCRRLFPPLTELTSLFYVSGDGQEATPDPTQPATTALPLPHPLKVGVSNGEWPVANARVRFAVKAGGGALTPAGGIVLTGADGVASCAWAINHTVVDHEVQAELLDVVNQRVHLPVIFHARANVARKVAYDPAKCDGMKNAAPPVVTVQDALDFLCHQSHDRAECCVTIGRMGDRPGDYETIESALEDLLGKQKLTSICLSLLPGDHPIGKDLTIGPVGKAPTFVKIAGCSLGSRLQLRETSLTFQNLAAVIVRDISIEIDDGMLTFDRDRHVEISGCRIAGTTEADLPLVAMGRTERIVFENNTVEARAISTILKSDAQLAGVFKLASETDFKAALTPLVENLAALDTGKRSALVDRFEANLAAAAPQLSAAETKSYGLLSEALSALRIDRKVLAERLDDVYKNAAKLADGLALALVDPLAIATIENNQIAGRIQLGGRKPAVPLDYPMLTKLAAIKTKLAFTPTQGSIHFRGNRVTQLAVSADLFSPPKVISAGGGQFETWHALFVTENTFTGHGSFLVAQSVTHTSNRFLDLSSDAGCTVARQSAYVGNSANDDYRWFNISQSAVPAQPATLNLRISILLL